MACYPTFWITCRYYHLADLTPTCMPLDYMTLVSDHFLVHSLTSLKSLANWHYHHLGLVNLSCPPLPPVDISDHACIHHMQWTTLSGTQWFWWSRCSGWVLILQTLVVSHFLNTLTALNLQVHLFWHPIFWWADRMFARRSMLIHPIS